MKMKMMKNKKYFQQKLKVAFIENYTDFMLMVTSLLHVNFL